MNEVNVNTVLVTHMTTFGNNPAVLSGLTRFLVICYTLPNLLPYERTRLSRNVSE